MQFIPFEVPCFLHTCISIPSALLIVLVLSHLWVPMCLNELDHCVTYIYHWDAGIRLSLWCISGYTEAFAMNIAFNWLFKTCTNLVLCSCIILVGVKIKRHNGNWSSINFIVYNCISIQTTFIISRACN